MPRSTSSSPPTEHRSSPAELAWRKQHQERLRAAEKELAAAQARAYGDFACSQLPQTARYLLAAHDYGASADMQGVIIRDHGFVRGGWEFHRCVDMISDRLGAERAHAELAARDAETAERLHPNDRRRVVRALELAALGSRLPSAERLWTEETRHSTIVFGLDLSREALAERIEARARAMFAAGVKAEVDAALADGPSSTVAHALGLREISQLPPDEALRALIVRTRRYAAYQRKWMRRIPSLVSVNADRPPDDIADEIVEVARARQRLPAGRAG